MTSCVVSHPTQGIERTPMDAIHQISRDEIRRLSAEGDTPRQIATKLGVAQYFIEKVLRGEAELLSKRKPPKGEPE